MRSIQRFKMISGSLFIQLLLSFLAILVPLLSFFFFSFTLLKKHAAAEVIRYNTLNMNRTIDKYENHFSQIRSIGLDLLLDEKLASLDRSAIDYINARLLMKSINGYLSHTDIAAQNIFISFKQSDFVISSDRGADAQEMFARYYHSDDYGPDFWTSQFDQPGSFRILPASDFSEVSANQASFLGRYIPVVIRNSYLPDYQVIIMLDADKMLASFNDSAHDQFMMLGTGGSSLFAENVSKLQSLPALPQGKHYAKSGKDFYFYRTGNVTGIQYVNIVPDNIVTDSLRNMNKVLVTLLLLFTILSFGAAWFFTKRFHNPIKGIMKSIQELNTPSSVQSNIHEFQFIHDQVRHLVQTNNTIDQANSRKNSLLSYYAFMNKIKNIKVSDQEIYDFAIEVPYRLLLFRLQFTPAFYADIDENEGRASYFVREYIDSHLKEHVQTQTVQLERDQILSLVSGDAVHEDIPAFIDQLKEIFDLDQRYWSITIGVGDLYRHSSDLTTGYEQVLALMGNRKLENMTQIITLADPPPEWHTPLTRAQEQELDMNLAAGNRESVLRIVCKVFGTMEKKAATAEQFYAFADSLTQLAAKSLDALQLDAASLQRYLSSAGRVRGCSNIEELRQYVVGLLTFAADRIHERKASRDNIIDFVTNYMEEHYRDDITLDILSDKLNISASYLSTYFKTKTGMNFIDYINNYRIDLAKSLLKGADMRIQDVASEVGYQNINSFNRMFKKISGITPSEFRKQHYILEG
ncbi:helix-turn-helix transcriptional regulator [Paenibacillus rhizovicinus]|uniref:Helix-turn-helix transcriptional regulator n=1 Tax=Paenibacillus rhizovicinus TaxID=2704463 RepID=A0A6C0PAT9_9BACL|nr:AraC family transcriptional regulator [Paenibacillus rhizovicinus]QHW34773.1 helix-turn-helix transcriptional regulator [Paenibacillus rhizovicinus]